MLGLGVIGLVWVMSPFLSQILCSESKNAPKGWTWILEEQLTLGSSTRETQAAVSRKEEHHGAGANSRGALQSSRGAQIPWAHRTGPGHFDLKELG